MVCFGQRAIYEPSSRFLLPASIVLSDRSMSEDLLLVNSKFYIQTPAILVFQSTGEFDRDMDNHTAPFPLLTAFRSFLKTITTNRRWNHTTSTHSSHTTCIFRNPPKPLTKTANQPPTNHQPHHPHPLADHPTRSGSRRTLPK